MEKRPKEAVILTLFPSYRKFLLKKRRLMKDETLPLFPLQGNTADNDIDNDSNDTAAQVKL